MNYSHERFPSWDRDRNSGSFDKVRDFSPRSQNYSDSKNMCFYRNEQGHIIHIICFVSIVRHLVLVWHLSFSRSPLRKLFMDRKASCV